jgi:hypothetical protein
VHPDDSRREFRKQRFSNARYFFLKDPLAFLATTHALAIPTVRALVGAGPSLRAVCPPIMLTEWEMEIVRECRASMIERCQQDYDEAVARNLKLYGLPYGGD